MDPLNYVHEEKKFCVCLELRLSLLLSLTDLMSDLGQGTFTICPLGFFGWVVFLDLGLLGICQTDSCQVYW